MLTQAATPRDIALRYGYESPDAYFYTEQREALQNEFIMSGAKIIKPLSITDYKNREFVIEDINGRWIGFGIKV
jgi:hypothetical protein